MLLLYFSNGIKVAVGLLSISCHGIFYFSESLRSQSPEIT